MSDDEIALKNSRNGTDIGKYRVLSEPITDCYGFTMLIEATCENRYDNVKACRIYLRELSGQWIEIGEIDIMGWAGINDGPATGSSTFSFENAISFDAYACLCDPSEDAVDYTSGSRLSKLVFLQ